MYTIAFLSGKGGVTKTSLARAVAVTFIQSDWQTGVLDIDEAQASFRKWNERRQHFGHQPDVPVISGTLHDLHKLQKDEPFHLLVVDGAAYGSEATVQVAQAADMVVISCRFSMDDMESAVETMNGLVMKGIPQERFCVVFSGVPEQRSPASYVAAQQYMKQTPYFLVDGFIEQKNSLTDAQNMGLALNEVQYPSLRQKIESVMDGVATRLQQLVSEA